MSIEERLELIEAKLAVLIERQTIREWYSTEEFSLIVGRAEFTVRSGKRAAAFWQRRKIAAAALSWRGSSSHARSFSDFSGRDCYPSGEHPHERGSPRCVPGLFLMRRLQTAYPNTSRMASCCTSG